jgi:hypothetical protein
MRSKPADSKRRRSTGAVPHSRSARMPKWESPSLPIVARFEKAIAVVPGIRRRKMFGCPAAFVNGQMFAGVFQSSVFVRLVELRTWLLRAGRYASSLPAKSQR